MHKTSFTFSATHFYYTLLVYPYVAAFVCFLNIFLRLVWYVVIGRYALKVETMATFTLFMILLLIVTVLELCSPTASEEGVLPVSYTREALLLLRWAGTSPLSDLPEEVRLQSAQHRCPQRRGERYRIRQRQRGSRPPLPSMIQGNSGLLRPKIEVLSIYTRGCFDFEESSIRCSEGPRSIQISLTPWSTWTGFPFFLHTQGTCRGE